jgi:hypothetical protein
VDKVLRELRTGVNPGITLTNNVAVNVMLFPGDMVKITCRKE